MNNDIDIKDLSLEQQRDALNFINSRKLNNCTDYTKNNKCTRCGNCCSNNIPLTQKEIQRIKSYIKKNNIEPEYHLPLVVTNVTQNDFVCPFLRIKNNISECLIYSVRPFICQKFICNSKLLEYSLDDIIYLQNAKTINIRQTFFN